MAWFILLQTAMAQVFTNNNAGLRSEFNGSVVCGDFDADGRLDLLSQGIHISTYYTTIWQNLGSGTFNNYVELDGPSLQGSAFGAVAAGDFFNSGLIDAIETGKSGSVDVGQLWHNLGNGNFTLITNTGILPSENSGIAVGDFNNDGRMDFVMTGVAVSGLHVRVFLNLGNGIFTNITVGVTGGGPIFVGDFDNDGYLDILFGAQLLRNLGDGTFTNVPSGLPSNGTAVGDFDNDGYLDVLVGGTVWRNLGNNTFTNIGSGLSATGLSVGDFDNDGNLDVLALSGSSQSSFAQVWRNLGAGNFTNAQSVAGGGTGSVAWGDFNGDGRLDFFVTGQTGVNSNANPVYAAQIWLNSSGGPSNAPPTAPTNLTSQSFPNGGVKMIWGAATDDHTPSSGLNYNVRVGTTSGGVDIVAPESDTTTGRRLVVQMGNAYERLFSLVTNLTGGTYYWSVQAIDTAYAGGPFAVESNFTIAPRISSFNYQTNGQFQVVFNVLATNSYTLQTSTDFMTWTNIANVIAATNGPSQLVDTNLSAYTCPWRYYRLKCP